MKHDELVKALRCEGFCKGCETCHYSAGIDEDGCTIRCKYEEMESDAAAAIEELQAEVESSEQNCKQQLIAMARHNAELQAEVKRLEPKRGEWVVDGMYTYNLRELNGKAYEPVYRCSCCNRQMESYLRLDEPKIPEDADFPEYCPHCGAKMEVQDA